MMHVSPVREPLINGEKSYKDITNDVMAPIRAKPGKLWFIGLGISMLVMLVGFAMIGYTVWFGIGTWGINRTIGWGWGITNFVWWVGIGHAGTFISAILLLFRQKWRTSINRAAEAMTIFAVMCAGLFPLIHMGRMPLGFFILPYPNTRELWVNFNSPLLWDVFAITTYLLVSLLFWYMGLIPDLGTIRDRMKTLWKKKVYNFLSFGWKGSARHWQRHESMSLILAGLAHHHFSALFCFRSCVFGFCHGAHTHDCYTKSAELPGIYYRWPRGIHEQSDYCYRLHCGNCLHNRAVYGMVQRCGIRALRVHEQGHGTLCLGILDYDDLQRNFTAVAVD